MAEFIEPKGFFLYIRVDLLVELEGLRNYNQLTRRESIIYQSSLERLTSAEIRDFAKRRKRFPFSAGWKSALGQVLEKYRRQGIGVVTYLDPHYPKLLREVQDYPAALYYRGNYNLLAQEHAVAMVGSRKATSYGLAVARKFSARIAEAGAVIVSGMALGIDAACHQGALQVEGQTIAVLGTPIDTFYPRENENLGRKILAREGLIVSEYPPGFWTNKFNFPMRNRIIAGLSRATVVVEAAENSGALITAGLALDYNRDLYAVPGEVGRISSQGTNLLLTKGAICLSDPMVIIEDLGLKKDVTRIKLSPTEQKVVDAIRSGVKTFDKIVKTLEIAPTKLNIIAGRLEIKGVLKRSADEFNVFD